MNNCEQGWRDVFKVHCNALFQTALLLTADVPAAEEALVGSIDDLDISISPERHGVAVWEKAVVMHSIETARHCSSAADPVIRSMLQPELLPVIEIEKSPRICFVLRMLLGYTADVCAQMLGTDENSVRMLLQIAVFSFNRNSQLARFERKQ